MDLVGQCLPFPMKLGISSGIAERIGLTVAKPRVNNLGENYVDLIQWLNIGQDFPIMWISKTLRSKDMNFNLMDMHISRQKINSNFAICQFNI